jgi:membrane protein DedA with SNARE-associated domain
MKRNFLILFLSFIASLAIVAGTFYLFYLGGESAKQIKSFPKGMLIIMVVWVWITMIFYMKKIIKKKPDKS